jgi:hypothetical protein
MYRDEAERESDLILSVFGKDVKRLYEEREKRHLRRAEMYDEAADKMAQAIAAAPQEVPVQQGPEDGRLYEGVSTLAVRESPRANAATYRTLARNERTKAAVAGLCAKGAVKETFFLTEAEVAALHND